MGSSAPKEKERINQTYMPHAVSISESSSKKLYNAIVRIIIKINEIDSMAGTGFFLRHKLKNKTKNYLITCNHVITESFIKEKKVIKLYYGEKDKEKFFEIKLDKGERFIKCFDEKFDVTILEILKKDKVGGDKYLLPNFDYKNGYDNYKGKCFYLAGYPGDSKNQERKVASGQIKELLEKPEFEHTLDTINGFSGSPICDINNLFVVGIHKSGCKLKEVNFGTFLGYIIDELEKEENLGNELEEMPEKKEELNEIKNDEDNENKEKIIKDNLNEVENENNEEEKEEKEENNGNDEEENDENNEAERMKIMKKKKRKKKKMIKIMKKKKKKIKKN